MPALLLCLCLFWACSGSPAGPGKDPARLVAGVDFDRLFAPPTPEELTLISTQWAARPAPAYTEVLSATVPLGAQSASLHILAYTVAGARLYGALLVPRHAAPGSLPLIVYAHGGDQGASVEELALLSFALATTRGQYAYALPAFRAEALSYGQQTFMSEGEPSLWDGDVDDGLAFIAVALAAEPALDPGQVGAVGISRGGAVALLMAIRDSRLSRVVDFFGPTDLLDVFGQEVAAEALLGKGRLLPGLDYLNRTLLQPLKQGTLGIPEARLELIRRSPVYFADRLPAVQVHHGTADSLVPVSQAQRLIDAMQRLGRAAPEFQSYLYPGGGHDPLSLPGSLGRAQLFLAPLRQPVPAFSAAFAY
ncbi:MAG: peptidase [Candidatus Latescibacteria bacterium]|nr:peptidase [Candidatus Latescibacterota bacterium]